jgi:L-rhamnose mutarotase
MQRRRDHRLAQLTDAEVMRKWWAHMADLMQTDSACVPLQVPLQPMFHLAPL